MPLRPRWSAPCAAAAAAVHDEAERRAAIRMARRRTPAALVGGEEDDGIVVDTIGRREVLEVDDSVSMQCNRVGSLASDEMTNNGNGLCLRSST